MKFEEVSDLLCTQFLTAQQFFSHQIWGNNFSQSPAIILVNKFTLVPALDSSNCKPC
jgi:hypothetical protein